MAKTPAQRGSFGRWLTEAREARYKRQVDALEAMRRLAGLHISASEYAQWESGSRVPKPGNPKVDRLYEFFGSRPDEAEAVSGEPDLAAAIRDLADAIRSERAERLEWERGFLEAMRQLARAGTRSSDRVDEPREVVQQ